MGHWPFSLHVIVSLRNNVAIRSPRATSLRQGHKDLFAFLPVAKIKVLPPSSWRQATVHRTVAFRWFNSSAPKAKKSNSFCCWTFLAGAQGLEP